MDNETFLGFWKKENNTYFDKIIENIGCLYYDI